jgi:hypothetical protein
MSRKKMNLSIEGPFLPGCITTAKSKCGKTNCACKENPPKLHGPYYRWTGIVNGKYITKTISKDIAQECERRIKNYRAFQKMLGRLLKEAVKNAPWAT